MFGGATPPKAGYGGLIPSAKKSTIDLKNYINFSNNGRASIANKQNKEQKCL
jgi:hypothetical protein